MNERRDKEEALDKERESEEMKEDISEESKKSIEEDSRSGNRDRTEVEKEEKEPINIGEDTLKETQENTAEAEREDQKVDEEKDKEKGKEESSEEVEIEIEEEEKREQKKEEEKMGSLKNQIELYEKMLKEYEEKWLRAIAEFDNFRKRTEKEKEQFFEYTLESFVKDFLPIIDSLEKACNNVDNLKGDTVQIVEGIKLIYKNTLSILNKYGVKQIKALGEEFDPNYHEAISKIPAGEHPHGRIVEEIQKGYLLKSRLIRPSLVVVAVEDRECESNNEEGEEEKGEKNAEGGNENGKGNRD